ncbi:hypothetical protein VYU27_003006 [Nannochloropsis oceanica]
MSFSFSFDLPAEPLTTSSANPEPLPLPHPPSGPSSTLTPVAPARLIQFIVPPVLPLSRSVSLLGDSGGSHQVGTGASIRIVESVAGVMVDVPDGVDLVPGVYEGGLKVWESSVDLVRYLQQHNLVQLHHRVLELGCGHGLPGIHALQQGAASVTFLDLNEEVLREVTGPNICLNVDSTDDLSKRVTLVSGDWEAASEVLNQHVPAAFDVIVSAETFYTSLVTEKLLNTIHRHLARQPPGAVAIVAGKRYYFGTGGSVVDLGARASALGFESRVVASVEDGKSNIRDLIEITWK